MTDPLRERYDAVPYHHGAIPESHPARIGAIARMLGIPAAPPDRCRVLELGCALGMNLLPLAERFPLSDFTGVDFSPVQIATAEAARVAGGQANVRFVCADLRDFEPKPGSFDYVIAHGVYSWVTDEVKDRLLAIASRALAPDGVAYVSYNTLPGWGLLAGIREVFLAETSRLPTFEGQLAEAARILETLSRAVAGQPGAYAASLCEVLSDMSAKSPALLFHDELATVNDPCTFTTFTEHSARHSLHYLGEAHYAAAVFAHVPAPMRAALAAITPDARGEQQFMDVLFQRWHRNSLLTRSEVPARPPDSRALRHCALGLRLSLADASVNLQPGVPLRLHGRDGGVLEFTHPSEKALLATLAQAAPARVPFTQAVERADWFLQQVRLPRIDDPDGLCAMLYELFASDALDSVLVGDGRWLGTALAPAPSPLMRYQARHGLPLANRWHELIALTAEGCASLADAGSAIDPAALQRAGLLV